MSSNTVWHAHKFSRAERSKSKKLPPCLLWIIGLSRSGKSNIASALDITLHKRGDHTFPLDDDNVRNKLNKDPGFADKDRVENIRRIGEVSKLFTDSMLIVLSAFISSFTNDRRVARNFLPSGSSSRYSWVRFYQSTRSVTRKDCARRHEPDR